jgi:hypothetical protein
MKNLKNLSKNKKVLVVLGLLVLGYYFYTNYSEKQKVQALKDGANTPPTPN